MFHFRNRLTSMTDGQSGRGHSGRKERTDGLFYPLATGDRDEFNTRTFHVAVAEVKLYIGTLIISKGKGTESHPAMVVFALCRIEEREGQ